MTYLIGRFALHFDDIQQRAFLGSSKNRLKYIANETSRLLLSLHDNPCDYILTLQTDSEPHAPVFDINACYVV